ncbi:MAG TPA: hypothetical protein VKY74_04315 [Chloroflexia bacterium]|nr:hypothetical protein [Chloroflexia bacterium]
MAFFTDSTELQQILGGFFERMRDDTDLGPRVRTAEVLVTFFLSDPDLTVTVDGVSPPVQNGHFNLYYGPPPLAPAVTLTLSADNAHRFWQGRLNVMLALAQKQVIIEGSAGKMLALLPVVAPAFERYRAYLTEIGRADLLA